MTVRTLSSSVTEKIRRGAVDRASVYFVVNFNRGLGHEPSIPIVFNGKWSESGGSQGWIPA
jgi:hypothetical protein